MKKQANQNNRCGNQECNSKPNYRYSGQMIYDATFSGSTPNSLYGLAENCGENIKYAALVYNGDPSNPPMNTTNMWGGMAPSLNPMGTFGSLTPSMGMNPGEQIQVSPQLGNNQMNTPNNSVNAGGLQSNGTTTQNGVAPRTTPKVQPGKTNQGAQNGVGPRQPIKKVKRSQQTQPNTAAGTNSVSPYVNTFMGRLNEGWYDDPTIKKRSAERLTEIFEGRLKDGTLTPQEAEMLQTAYNRRMNENYDRVWDSDISRRANGGDYNLPQMTKFSPTTGVPPVTPNAMEAQQQSVNALGSKKVKKPVPAPTTPVSPTRVGNYKGTHADAYNYLNGRTGGRQYLNGVKTDNDLYYALQAYMDDHKEWEEDPEMVKIRDQMYDDQGNYNIW